MIMLLDHITIAVAYSKIEQAIAQWGGNYTKRFQERDLVNIPAKQDLFQCAHPNHCLVKMDRPGCYPLEFVGYDECQGQSSKKLEMQQNGRIIIPTLDEERSRLFWETLGFQAKHAEGKTVMSHRGSLDKIPTAIELLPTADPNAAKDFLDQEGIVALAFVVRHQDELRRCLYEAGFFITEKNVFCVHGRNMDISFASSRYGDVAELISIQRK